MKFTKMHGIGNDYVYVNGFVENVTNPVEMAKKVSPRNFAIGADGLILILPPNPGVAADVRMRMFNADGSEGEMCGNGVRCVAKYSYDHGLTKSNPMRVETGRGVLTMDLVVKGNKVESVTVDMGEPYFDLPRVPVDESKVIKSKREYEYKLSMAQGNELIEATFVSTGNPHAVIFVEDVAKIDLARVGPLLEHHKAFPKRANIHFAQVVSPSEVIMRTWERGSGITLACGTGASAVAVSAAITGRTGRKVLAHLPGGDLILEWKESDGHVYMTGPATEVFSGEWPD